MLISDEYRQLNRDLHSDDPGYGVSVRTIETGLQIVSNLIEVTKAKTVLDYGCGKGKLIEALQARWPAVAFSGYDPAVEQFNKEPSLSDVVISFDVMEHIEPDCIVDVVCHIREMTRIAAMLGIATKPALKTLRDGRNAHLIVEPHVYWQDFLGQYMKVVHHEEYENSSVFVLQHRKG